MLKNIAGNIARKFILRWVIKTDDWKGNITMITSLLLAVPWKPIFLCFFRAFCILCYKANINVLLEAYAKNLEIGTWQLCQTQDCFHLVFVDRVENKWQHRKLLNVNCPQIFGKRYFCCINSITFLKSWVQLRTPTDLE